MARDELVQSAIDNWAPRFISNGIDSNDFQRVTGAVERWDDWCRAWSECGAMHAQMGEEAEARGYYTSAGQHYLSGGYLLSLRQIFVCAPSARIARRARA